MSKYLLPITLETANRCSICKEQNIINWKKHYCDKHPVLVSYHILKQMNKIIGKV